MDFSGTQQQLIEAVQTLTAIKETRELSPTHIQIKTTSGVVVNFYPKQKSVTIQGKFAESENLRGELKALLIKTSVKSPPKRKPSAPTKPVEPQYAYRPIERPSSDPAYITDKDSELVIALVAAVGTDLSIITNTLTERLKTFKYETTEIKISNHIIAELRTIPQEPHFERISALMTEGNKLRESTGDYSVLAKLAAAKINEIRVSTNEQLGIREELAPMRRRAFIISSLKHPSEVAALRKIYANGFFMIGVHGNKDMRYEYLHENKKIPEQQVNQLFERDQDEGDKHGQHTRDTYHLSDFFVDFGDNRRKFEKDVWRVLDLIFGKPFITPTFDEFAMFMAFSASLRSADLSRQVGAVVTRDHAIVATGANDVPQFGGGLYWPDYYGGHEIHDQPSGRDYIRKGDTNVIEKNDIIADILSKVPSDQRSDIEKILNESKLKNITEYGRVVHAEMEAILSCARGSIGTRGAHLYCTTFPCHNCAKHIIASGIDRVVYVEPYPKSKAFDFHNDSITLTSTEDKKVKFEPFVGVGPRSFFNLFSVNIGAGYEIIRKTKDGKPVEWKEEEARLRMQMLPISYIERESVTTKDVNKLLEKKDEHC